MSLNNVKSSNLGDNFVSMTRLRVLESVFTSLRQRSFILLHFIFRCLLPLIHMHSVRGMPSSDGRVSSLVSLMFVPAGLVKIYQNSSKLISVIYSHRWYFGQTRVNLVIRSRLWSSKISNDASRP